MPTQPDASFTHKLQDGERIPEVVITLWQKTISGWSQRLWKCIRARPIHFYRCRHFPTLENIIRYKSEVETVPKTGSTNNLTTETDIDAISVFLGASFSLVFTPTSPDASFTQTFYDGGRIPEVVITLRRKTISRWSERLQQCFRARPSTFTGVDNVRLRRTASGTTRK